MPTAARNQDPDVELIERYFAGIRAPLKKFIRYERQIYRVCYRFVKHREEAMDLAQDVFVKAFEHLPTFRRESTLKTWLYRIAINHCLNHVKKHSQEFVQVTESTSSTKSSAQAELEHQEQRQRFRRLVKRLPPKQKAILELRVNEQLSYEEIAKISGRSVSTIKASVFFALEKLRKFVKDPRA